MTIVLQSPHYSVLLKPEARACDALVWAEGFRAPIEGQWWYEALEQSALEDQFQFLYFEVRNSSDEAIAIAPAFLMDVPLHMFVPEALVPIIRPLGSIWPGLMHQRTLFIGSPCSDEGHIGFKAAISDSERREVMTLLKAALIKTAERFRAPMRVFKDFQALPWDPESPWRDFFVVESFPGAIVHFPETDLKNDAFESYLMSIKGSRRQKLRRTLKRAEAKGPLQVEWIQHPEDALIEQLFALFYATYEAGEVQFERLTLAFFQEMAKRPEVEFLILKSQEGKILAFMMLFTASPEAWINKFIGIDYAHPKEAFLYFQLWAAAVKEALRRGVQSIQSGQTDYDAKISVGHSIYPLKNICQHRHPLIHWIYKTVGQRLHWPDLDPALKRIQDDAVYPHATIDKNR